jgi:two-component sensor histidine kinase
MAKALLGENVVGFEEWLAVAGGELIPVVVNAAPIRNWEGQIIGAISTFTDLRSYKAQAHRLHEKVTAGNTKYRELIHRVKNHLQMMSSLVSLQARTPAISATELASDLQGQIQALAAVYKAMDQAEVGDRVEAHTLLEQVRRPYWSQACEAELEVAPPDLTLTPEQAGPVGMLVNEAVSNSCKHAFPHGGGRIHVSLRRLKPGSLRLEVADDGVGWGPVPAGKVSHGLDLMRVFAKQLQGELELSRSPSGGALVATDIREPEAT